MIILYVPFYEENDLFARAVSWQNELTDKDTIIIQHGNTINYRIIEDNPLKIYVLAHEVEDLIHYAFHLASTSLITNKTTYLHIEEIANRFNSDFTFVNTQVKNIKLYFCNNKGNQKSIAEKFNHHLGLFNSRVDYYAGTIFSPFSDKKKYSQYSGQWYRCSKIRKSIYHDRENLDSDWHYRIDPKARTQIEFLNEVKQRKMDLHHRARQKLFMEHRCGKQVETREAMEDVVSSPALLNS